MYRIQNGTGILCSEAEVFISKRVLTMWFHSTHFTPLSINYA